MGVVCLLLGKVEYLFMKRFIIFFLFKICILLFKLVIIMIFFCDCVIEEKLYKVSMIVSRGEKCL